MVDFSLLRTPDFFQAALGGYKAGHALAQGRRKEEALQALGADPDNPAALQRLATVDPEQAARYQDFRIKSETRRRDADFRMTMADWILQRDQRRAGMQGAPGGGPALGGGIGQASPVAPALGGQGVSMGQAPAAERPALSPPSNGMAAASVPPPMASVAADRDRSYERMVRANPEGALKAQGERQKLTKNDLELFQAVNETSLQLMGGVHDQASYDAAKVQAHQLHERYGIGPDALALPDQYSPQLVEGLMMRALKTKDQLAEIRADKRLQWDIEDDTLDNERADRNTSSQIAHRGAQEQLTARGQNLTDARGRYGIDIASTDRRRGQDLTSTDRRRGQDLAPRRGGRSGNAIPTVSTPEQARALPPGTVFQTPDGKVKVR